MTTLLSGLPLLSGYNAVVDTPVNSATGDVAPDIFTKTNFNDQQLFLIARLRALIAQAQISNAVSAQPLIQPSAYVNSTAYVRGQSFSANSNNYTVMVGGTSAASSSPSFTNNALTTDGTVGCYYMGPAYTTSALAPTYTNVASGSKYTGVFWRNTNSTRPDGSSQISDTGNFWLTNSTWSETGSQNALISGTSGVTGAVSFMTDAPAFQIVCNGGTAPVAQVYVNGVPLTLGFGSLNTAGGAVGYLQLVFTSQTPRLITLEQNAGLNFYGVLMNDTISKVWAPRIANTVRVGVVGTSYVSGSAAHPVTPAMGIGPLVGKSLGCLDIYSDAKGSGSGYIATGGNGAFGIAARVNALIAYAPDVVIVTGGGINDSGAGATLATETAAVLAYITAVRAGLPKALMLMIGSEAGTTGPNSSIFNMELAVSNAVTTFNDPFCFYIPQSSTLAERAWISGTGTTAATNGSGNSDVYIYSDGTHPVQAGVSYLVMRHINGILSTLTSIV